MLDTNVLLDYLLGRQPVADQCSRILRCLLHEGTSPIVSSLSLKDCYYLVGRNLKKAIRDKEGTVSDADALAVNEVAWACVDTLLRVAEVSNVGKGEVLGAKTLRFLHGDFEDDLILASAQSLSVDLLVSSDQNLLRHAPVACLTPQDACLLLDQRDL